MDKRIILEDISSLINDIDKCTNKIVEADLEDNEETFMMAVNDMVVKMTMCQQELNFLYDYIKNGDSDTKYTGITVCGGPEVIEW